MTNPDATRPSAKVFLKTVLLASAITLSVAALLVNLWHFLGTEISNGADLDGGYLATAFSAGVVGPLIETALMAAVISLFLKQLFNSNAPVIIVSALLWAVLHGVFDIWWGVNAFFGFVVFSAVYLKFIDSGFWWAFSAASLNHAIHNFVVVTLAYL